MSIHSSHILIVRTDNIGDVILTLPMIARLKQLQPTAKISLLCRAYAAPVVRYCTDVDGVIELETITGSLCAFLKQSAFDTIIIAQPDRAFAVAAFRANIRHRIGNARQKLYLLFYCNRRVRFSKGLSEDHEAQINFCFLRPYGSNTIPDRSEIPALYHFNIPIDTKIQQQFQAYSFNLVLHTKSNGHGREWPIEHYQTLAQCLADQPGIHLWLTGSADEGKWLAQHADALLRLPNVTCVCGTQTLAELAAFIHQADGLVASGTGPLHLSAAIGQRTLGLFPPTRPMHPGRWAAIGSRAHNLSVADSCPNCRKITTATCACMRRITPESVFELIMQWKENKQGMAS